MAIRQVPALCRQRAHPSIPRSVALHSRNGNESKVKISKKNTFFKFDFKDKLNWNPFFRGTFHNLSAVFSPACIAHEVITKVDWTTVNVEGVTLPDALNCWASSLPDYIPDFSNELGDKDLLGTGNDVLMSGNNRPRLVP